MRNARQHACPRAGRRAQVEAAGGAGQRDARDQLRLHVRWRGRRGGCGGRGGRRPDGRLRHIRLKAQVVVADISLLTCGAHAAPVLVALDHVQHHAVGQQRNHARLQRRRLAQVQRLVCIGERHRRAQRRLRRGRRSGRGRRDRRGRGRCVFLKAKVGVVGVAHVAGDAHQAPGLVAVQHLYADAVGQQHQHLRVLLGVRAQVQHLAVTRERHHGIPLRTRRRSRRGRFGRRRRRGRRNLYAAYVDELHILARDVADHAVARHFHPAGSGGVQHRQHLAAVDVGKHFGAQVRLRAQVQVSAAEHDIGQRVRLDLRGRRLLRSGRLLRAGKRQIAAHHIPRLHAVAHATPGPVVLQHVQDRPVRDARDDARVRALIHAQVEHVVDGREGHRRLRDGVLVSSSGRLGGSGLRPGGAVQRRQQSVAREADLHARGPRIVKVEDLLVTHALGGHLLRAALAHADAMPVATGGQAERQLRLLYLDQLVLRRVQAHAQRLLQL